ncbi:hypothetical protein PARC_a0711 [Pseudoalteromonas arctica A 37-1-2]|uniref:Uncharacterized protein n=1 Tax=Pseudoalteromonas arctica A 37-1-2 TaxID=1117313 RepID=A0A290S345_9GAMM|nr:hypothetical protein PARC_a0711 [Pseudoalteromonas arctica A 37-1-2]
MYLYISAFKTRTLVISKYELHALQPGYVVKRNLAIFTFDRFD